MEERSGLTQSWGLSTVVEDPITFDVMVDAVITPCGHSFDSSSIEGWLQQGNASCPLCFKPLQRDRIQPNFALREVVQQYLAMRERQQELRGPLSSSSAGSSQEEVVGGSSPLVLDLAEWSQINQVVEPDEWRMLVQVIGARNVKKSEKREMCCSVRFSGIRKRTRMIARAALPEWKEEFLFAISGALEGLTGRVRVDLIEAGGIFSREESLGEVEVRCAEIVERKKILQWFPLLSKGKRAKCGGELYLRIQVLNLKFATRTPDSEDEEHSPSSKKGKSARKRGGSAKKTRKKTSPSMKAVAMKRSNSWSPQVITAHYPDLDHAAGGGGDAGADPTTEKEQQEQKDKAESEASLPVARPLHVVQAHSASSIPRVHHRTSARSADSRLLPATRDRHGSLPPRKPLPRVPKEAALPSQICGNCGAKNRGEAQVCYECGMHNTFPKGKADGVLDNLLSELRSLRDSANPHSEPASVDNADAGHGAGGAEVAQPLCVPFQQSGRCHFGDLCRFRHVGAGAAAANNANEEQEEVAAEDANDADDVWTTSPRQYNQTNAPPPPPPPEPDNAAAAAANDWDANIAKLVVMGFSAEAAQNAMQQAGGNVEEALEVLLNDIGA